MLAVGFVGAFRCWDAIRDAIGLEQFILPSEVDQERVNISGDTFAAGAVELVAVCESGIVFTGDLFEGKGAFVRCPLKNPEECEGGA